MVSFKRYKKPLGSLVAGITAGAAISTLVNRTGISGMLGGVATFIPAVAAYMLGGPIGVAGYVLGTGALGGLLGQGTNAIGGGYDVA